MREVEGLVIPSEASFEVEGKILFLTYWNWNYGEFLSFEEQALYWIREDRKRKVIIFCNHPHCFTVGNGNERHREDLIDFDFSLIPDLPYPTHKIHRGGGLTFHYPGQIIIYPMMSLSPEMKLGTIMCDLLKELQSLLKSEVGLEAEFYTGKNMGLWVKDKKIASIGMGVSRFITRHGLAFNVNFDQEMFQTLSQVHPCGMQGDTYVSLEKIRPDFKGLSSLQSVLLEYFKKKYIL